MSLSSFELQPTKENLLETLSLDLLGRNETVWRFARLCNLIDRSCTIALDANWGQGKTFFVKHVQLLIESSNPCLTSLSDEEKTVINNAFAKQRNQSSNEDDFDWQVCVYYDAWIDDNDCDPILSLVYEILKCTAQHYTFKRGLDGVKAASTLVDFFTGRNTGDFLSLFQDKDPLSELKSQKEIHDLVDHFLDSLLDEQGNRLIVFIDELDRCKPDYAVRLLERIKHYFTNDRITFVFSVNIDELQHTVKNHYGVGFDACRYLDRFFDYRITLPPANLSSYYDYIGVGNNTYVFDNVCKSVIRHYNFGLREIEKYIRMTKISGYEITHHGGTSGFPDGNAKMFCMCIVLPIIVGLRMADTILYNDFINGNNSQPLLDIIGDGSLARNMMSMLLDVSESFDKALEKKNVLLVDKLQQVYDALFKSDEERGWDAVTIGQCAFSNETKVEVLKAASMLSKYAKYD